MEIVLIVAISALGLSAFLLLAMASIMREIVLLRGDTAALSQLITNPPRPDIIGELVPAQLRVNLVMPSKCNDGDSAGGTQRVILFVSDSCGSCQELATSLEPLLLRRELLPSDLTCVTQAPDGGKLSQEFRRLGVNVVLDKGELAKECDVRGTPMLLAVNGNGSAIDYTYGGGVEWIQRRLGSPARSMGGT